MSKSKDADSVFDPFAPQAVETDKPELEQATVPDDPARIEPDPEQRRNYEELAYADLQALCKSLGLPAGGKKAELVKLRYFAGLTIEQTAQSLDISPATAKRLWTYARAWLVREMDGTQ